MISLHSMMPFFAHKRLCMISSAAVVAAVVVFGCALSVPAYAARPETAPKIVNWNYSWSIDSDDEARALAKWDVVILDIENEYYNRDRIRLMREVNPDIKILAYISSVDIRPDATSLDTGTARKYIGETLEDNPEWILRTANGSQAHWWQDYDIMNITSDAVNTDGETFNDFFSKFIRDAVVKDKVWDGIFYDNLWESVSFVSTSIDLDGDGTAESTTEMDHAWRAGITKLLKRTRSYAKKYRNGFIITGNGGARYHKYLNGIGFEGYPDTVYGGWTESTKKYAYVLDHATGDPYVFINQNVGNTGERTDYQQFRFGLTSTLLFNGYYSFDNGDLSHTEQWYYDEYDVDLGDAISGAYNLLNPSNPTGLQKGVWRRDYEKATIIANSTDDEKHVDLKTGYEKIKGEQDTAVNSGEVVGSVDIEGNDGVVLLPRLSVVRDTTFINGAYAKVFDSSGNEERNSFFSYDGTFAGGVQVHKISGNSKKTVVGGDTTVQVYDNTNHKIAEFAPYGSGYTGGVNIAVGKLFGKKKTYIVVGNKTGTAQVKIYDLHGALINPGCYPYATTFKGGVNVAVGDLNGDNRMEIIAAAGFGGGPHVRILNNECEVINPGFFAFDKSLRIGVNMAVGDLNGDGKAEIIAASGPGGGPQVRIFNRNGKLISPGFFAYSTSDRSGVLVSTADIDGDGKDEIVTNSFSIFNQL